MTINKEPNEDFVNVKDDDDAVMALHDLSMHEDQAIASVGRILKKHQQKIVDDLIEEQKKTNMYIATNTLVHFFSTIIINFAANAARGHPGASAGAATAAFEGFVEIFPDEIKRLENHLEKEWEGSPQQKALDEFAQLIGTTEEQLTAKQNELNNNKKENASADIEIDKGTIQ